MEREIRGVVMHMELNGGVVNNYGTIAHLDGTNVSVSNHGTIAHNEGNVIGGEKVVFQDKVVYQDRIVYRDRPTSCESDLRLIQKLRKENDLLRAKLESYQNGENGEYATSDVDPLVSRVVRLHNQLDEERANHRRDVDELNWRIDSLREVILKLRHGGMTYQDQEYSETMRRQILDDCTDIIASLVAMFPYKPTGDISKELGLSRYIVEQVARTCHVKKSNEAKREANERALSLGDERIDKRGGHNKKQVEMVARNGRVIATFDSLAEASKATGIKDWTIERMCCGAIKKRIDGKRFRYKNSDSYGSES